jgi:glycosyltransferase involved in cell wall biosynthesis
VDPDAHLYLANLLSTCRADLESLLDEIHERGTPLTDLEVRLIKEVATSRLEFTEDQLRLEAQRRGHAGFRNKALRLIPAQLRRMAARLRGLTRPKIGRLQHYPPRSLLVPAGYFKTDPPSPAPTISIVTPSFAQGRFLERTLYSVLGQDYPALEYFVQDGGSTDETLETLRHYDGQLTGWASEPDDGQADAINRAFGHTTGELMGWLNSDDILLPGALAYVARYFSAHPEVDVVYGNRIMIDENDGQIGAWILPRHDDHALTFADFIPQETLFWRRSIWEAAGGRVDPTFGYALDWDLLLRFREAGATMVRLPRFLGAFRVHSEQKTSAEDVLGASECARLRARVQGRAVSVQEIMAELRPYLRRHVLAHSWQRFVDRMPRQRMRLATLPAEPWLQAPARTSPDMNSARGAALPRPEPPDTEATSATPVQTAAEETLGLSEPPELGQFPAHTTHTSRPI